MTILDIVLKGLGAALAAVALIVTALHLLASFGFITWLFG
jgi:hypothetical protein